MTTLHTDANPFALMLEPEAVFAAMAGSERLARLKSRICRPLDRPLVATDEGDDDSDGGDGVDALSSFGTEI